ncbi:hypothetical protein [Burkholderia gladioli]|uniref:hypothetical protein n=1 Tax=Burkholderia gladioli TaxID=28095 RepID=UPI00163EB9F0|nr:hypothetical protein [Burkholderia gladioli]
MQLTAKVEDMRRSITAISRQRKPLRAGSSKLDARAMRGAKPQSAIRIREKAHRVATRIAQDRE